MKPKTRRETATNRAILKVRLDNSAAEDEAKRRLTMSRRVAR